MELLQRAGNDPAMLEIACQLITSYPDPEDLERIVNQGREMFKPASPETIARREAEAKRQGSYVRTDVTHNDDGTQLWTDVYTEDVKHCKTTVGAFGDNPEEKYTWEMVKEDGEVETIYVDAGTVEIIFKISN
jgi:hypothetical protein